MSRVAATSDEGGAGAKIAIALAFVLAMSVVVVLLVRARPAPEPFDPRSGRPDGARGLVLTLERFGVEVDVARSVPGGDGADVLLVVLDDRLDDRQRSDLLDVVEAGGRVLVADPDSTLHGGSGLDGGAMSVSAPPLPDRRLDAAVEANLTPGRCTVPGLDPLRGLHVPDGLLFPVGPTEPSCFTREGHSFVIVRDVGAGSVIGLGDNEFLTNRYLRRADNAALVLALVDSSSGATPGTVTVLVGNGASPTIDDLGAGDDSLADLVPTWVWIALSVACVAMVVFAGSRAARVGRIVSEPSSTPVEGSSFVAATGNLMQRAGHAEHAAALMLARLRVDLCLAHRVEPSTPVDELDELVSARHDVAPGEVSAVLGTTVAGDRELGRLGVRVHELRRRALADDAATVDDPSAPDDLVAGPPSPRSDPSSPSSSPPSTRSRESV